MGARILIFLLAVWFFATNPAGAAPRPISITITSVECTQADECDAAGIEAAGQSWPDFYAKVFMNGVETRTPRAPDDQRRVEPNWTVITSFDDKIEKLPITIQIWDYDSTSGDDIADASPQSAHNNLDIVLDVAKGTWSGDTTTNCVAGDGVDTGGEEYYPVQVCFTISVSDADQDGLLDDWERFGLDVDGVGGVDLPLPAWGANPMRKDVFLELDYEGGRAPTKAGINAMKAAFAAAPLSNPDGSTGVNLHVDVGSLFDPTADEAGRVGTCSNGLDDDGDGDIDGVDAQCQFIDASQELAPTCNNNIDDDGDGLADAADPQCLVGDNLGGGSSLTIAAAARPCGLNANFATIKAAQFNANRDWVFRYGIQAAAPPNPPPPAAPLGCAGGQGEIGGNDFISHNLDAGTLLHEFGHNLNLQHGGSNSMNCKPNYLSVMNYNLQGGIPQVVGGFILDYSPPRTSLNGANRANAPLAQLVETALDETVPIDPADAVNSAVFMNGRNQISTIGANTLPDWTNDPSLPTAAGINIDNGIAAVPASPGVPAQPRVGAPGCANTVLNIPLLGDNDWKLVSLPFRQFSKSAPGVLDAANEMTPTDEEIEQLRRDIRRTDLALALTASPDPVAAGTPLTYSATITNNGPNVSLATRFELEVLNGGALFATLPADCVAPTPATVSCTLGRLRPREARSFDLVANVPANLVYDAGAPLPIIARGSVADRGGNDGNLADNQREVSVKAVAVADLTLTDFSAPNPPIQMLVGEQVVVELTSTVGSKGPSSPMDTVLRLNAEASGGATVSPTQLATAQNRLQQGESRAVANHPILMCSAPGPAEFRFTHEIAPARAPDTDPDTSNNVAELVLKVECLGSDSYEPQPQEPNPDEPSSPTEPHQPDLQYLPEALSQVGIDYSVSRDELVSWLSTSPPSTAYPAIVTTILAAGWRFASPVYLDVIVWNYENSPGSPSPRYPEDVDVELLKTAILAASNERYGTEVAEFEELLVR